MNLKEFKQYTISKPEYLAAKWFCMKYPLWKKRIAELSIIASPANDGMPHGTETGDPTGEKAVKAEALRAKIKIVEDAAQIAGDGWLSAAILKGATEQYCSYAYLKALGMIPCGERQYRFRRHWFFYLINEKI